jgi:DNA-binding XRE family transcriptional regulator
MGMYLQGYKSQKVTSRQLRQNLSVSNTRMAQLLGVSADTWLAWQSGRRKPSAAAYRLMEVLMWLFQEGHLSRYWWDCAEPKILRNYDCEDDIPEPLGND